MKPARQRRGQAAVEFALGSLVFVTVLLFGIHFAEVGYLSAKVHEAGAAAMWDATAFRTQSFGPVTAGGWYDASLFAAPSVGGATGAAARYADWDGRTRINTGSSPQMVLTKAQPMTVTCTTNLANTSYGLPLFAPDFRESGGVSCSAQGDFGFGLMRMPNKFAEGANGFFKAPHNSRIGSATTLCSSGRSTFGTSTCAGTLSVLLGDDSLTDGNQASECAVATGSGGATSCGNPRFYSMTKNTWDRSMQNSAGWGGGYTGAPENWADNLVTGVPGGEITGFYLSFRGEENGTPFTETVVRGNNGGTWQSSPMDAVMISGTPYRTAYQKRGGAAGGCSRTGAAISGKVPFRPIQPGGGGGGYCYLGKFPCGD